MAVFEFDCLGWHWMAHFSPLLHEWVEKFPLTLYCPHFGTEAFFPSQDEQLPAKTIVRSLVSGCSLCHEQEEDGCKGTCVKFGSLKPEITGDNNIYIS